MRLRTLGLVLITTSTAALLTGCGETAPRTPVTPTGSVAPSDGPTTSQRISTGAGAVTNACADALEDGTIPGSTELVEVRLERTSLGLAVQWETAGFVEGVTEFSINAVNASNQDHFDTLYVRVAGGRVKESYWREYTQPSPAITHDLHESPTGADRTLRAVFPLQVLDHLGPGFEWNAAVRHDQGGHDSCPASGSLIFDDAG